MKGLDENIYEYYKQLDPNSGQVVFRNLLRQLFRAIQGNWENLVKDNRLQESEELQKIYNLNNESHLQMIYELESDCFYNLVSHDVLIRYKGKDTPQSFFGKKNINWDWTFQVKDNQAFFDLYDQVFQKGEQSKFPENERNRNEANHHSERTIYTLYFESIKGKDVILIVDEVANKKFKLHEFKSKNEAYFIFEYCFRKANKTVTLKEIRSAFNFKEDADLDVKRFKESLANFFHIIGFRREIKQYFLLESSKDSIKLQTIILNSFLKSQNIEYKDLSDLGLKAI